MATNGAKKTKVVTGKVRLSYAHLFEPFSSNPDQEPKYSVMLLIPKSDKATMKKLWAAEEAAAEDGVDSRWKGRRPKNLGSIIHDGDEEADLELSPERAGHYYMTVSAKTKPGIVDRDLNPILDSTEVYSGCYARVSINAFPYSVQGNNGVSFAINHCMKWADGEMFGGRSSAEDDFADMDDDENDDDLV